MENKLKEELIDIASVIFGVIAIIALSFWVVNGGYELITDYFRGMCNSRIHHMCFLDI